MKDFKYYLNENDKEENILTPISKRVVKKGIKLTNYELRTKINCDELDENYELLLCRNYKFMQEAIMHSQQQILINELNSINFTYDNFKIDFTINNFGFYPNEYNLIISKAMALKLSCCTRIGTHYINHSPSNCGWSNLKNKNYNPNKYGLPKKYFGFDIFVLNSPQINELGEYKDWNTDTLYFIHKNAITEYRDKNGWTTNQDDIYQYLRLNFKLVFDKNLIKKIRPIMD